MRPKARPSIHEAILDWSQKPKKGSVLDVPASFGHWIMNLKEREFEVTCGEINPEILAVPEMK